MKDTRDPKILGAFLLTQETRPLSRGYDEKWAHFAHFPLYDSNPGPVEKYGDPRLIPSTMPNAVD